MWMRRSASAQKKMEIWIPWQLSMNWTPTDEDHVVRWRKQHNSNYMDFEVRCCFLSAAASNVKKERFWKTFSKFLYNVTFCD